MNFDATRSNEPHSGSLVEPGLKLIKTVCPEIAQIALDPGLSAVSRAQAYCNTSRSAIKLRPGDDVRYAIAANGS